MRTIQTRSPLLRRGRIDGDVYNARMPRLLTEQTFYRYLKCPHWVYFDAHADSVNPHDPLLAELVNEGLIEEKQRALLVHKPDLAEVTAEDPEAAFRQTLAFM